MPYDEDLAERIRDHLGDAPVTEKRMFGGIAFLVSGHMAVAASGQGGLMVRVDPAQTEDLVADDGVSRMVMRGKEMNGWLRVTSEALTSEDELARWVRVGTDFAKTLPPK